MTVDFLLTKIIDHHFSTVEDIIPIRDAKVLKNLARVIIGPVYITENQGNLLVKILKEHQDKFVDLKNEVAEVTAAPTWARQFRVLQNIRKIYITDVLGEKRITIEATFSADLRYKVAQLSKTTQGFVQELNGKLYSAELTEQNVVAIIDKLSPFGFDIAEDLSEYYKTIKSWSESEITDQYRITTISHPNFEKQLILDLGIDTAIDQNIINDRSTRYQYYVEKTGKSPENLTESIATRPQSKIWIDKTQHSLSDVFESLDVLKRFPVLVVLDSRDPKTCLEDLQNLDESLAKNGIFDGVGVYFRLDNSGTGKEFNQLIADKQYNCQLDENTKVVVVQSGKIPKFLLKINWKPMSVVSINHHLRHSKTAVYSNCCDLVVTYSNSPPVIEARSPWE